MRLSTAVTLLALAIAAVAGYSWWTSRGAIARAERADSLYRDGLVRERADSVARVAALAARDSLRRTADSSRAAAARSVDSAAHASAGLETRVATALKTAKTTEQQLAVYQAAYQESRQQVHSLLASAVAQQRALADLKLLQEADSARADREEMRGNRWKRAADSLALANADLRAHTGFSLHVGGVKGLVAGGAIVEVLHVLAGHP